MLFAPIYGNFTFLKLLFQITLTGGELVMVVFFLSISASYVDQITF